MTWQNPRSTVPSTAPAPSSAHGSGDDSKVTPLAGDALDVEITLEAAPSVLYDALVLPEGDAAAALLAQDANALQFVREQYRHGKPILAVGGGAGLLASASIPPRLPDGGDDPGLVGSDAASLPQALAAFKVALAGHRVYARETDPPRV